MKNYNNKLIFIVLIFLLFCCNSKQQKITSKKGHLQVINDTLYISNDLVMNVVLDTIKIQKLKKRYGDKFYTIMDDNSYYMYEVTQYIETKKLKMFTVSQNTVGYFIDNDYKFYNIDSMNSPLNLLLYKKNKKIIEVVPIDIDLEFDKYYTCTKE